MRCFNCGEEIAADEKFCYRCGFEQEQVVRIVEAAKNGSQDAITELYKRTYNNVYQSVRMMISDEDTVLDIVQDTYIRGFKYLNQLQDPRLFKAWIKRVGVNTAKNYLKKKKPILFSEMGGGEEDDRPELQFEDERVENLPEISMDKRETARIIKEVLDTLSEDQRMVITMYYYEDMNAREIADELGLSENTIRSRLNYGKKKIEAKILEIEKRDGIRLHTLAPVVFMAALFRSQEASAAEVPNPMMLQEIKRALLNNAGRAGAGSAAEGAGRRGAGNAAEGAGKRGTGNAAEGAGRRGAGRSAAEGAEKRDAGRSAAEGAGKRGAGRSAAEGAGRRGAETAVEGAGRAGEGTAARAAGAAAAKGISAKVVAGITAAVVATGGGAAYVVHEYNVYKESRDMNQDEAKNQDKLNEAADAENKADETGREGSEADGAAEDSGAEAPIRPWEAAADGLTAFAQEKEMLSGHSYNGYLANIDYVYDEGEYTSPGPDGSLLPQGWLDYSLADLDGDGEPELVAATVNAASETWIKNPVNVIGVEVYEWDSETESAYLASSMLTQPGNERNATGIRAGQSFGTLDCFIYGDGKKRIGFLQDYTMAPVFDGGGFDFQAFGYQDGELKLEMKPVEYVGNVFGDGEPEILEQMERESQEMSRIGVPINPNQVLTGEISGGDISQYAANYRCVARIESQSTIESYDSIHEWMDKAYGGESVEPLEAYIINCIGGDSHDFEPSDGAVENGEGFRADTPEETSADTSKADNSGKTITPLADSRYLQPGLNIGNIDPYAENIFPVIGLDSDFPLPKSDGGYSWEYITTDDMSSRYEGMSGETFALPEDIYLTLRGSFVFGEAYQKEINEYMVSRGYVKNGDCYWSENGLRLFVQLRKTTVEQAVMGALDEVHINACGTRPVHAEGVVTDLSDVNGLERPGNPASIYMLGDTITGAEFGEIMSYEDEERGLVEANVGIIDLYAMNEDETAYTEPQADFVNGESIELGSRISVDGRMPAAFEEFDSIRAGQWFGMATITCLD